MSLQHAPATSAKEEPAGSKRSNGEPINRRCALRRGSDSQRILAWLGCPLFCSFAVHLVPMQTAMGISTIEHHREVAALCGRLKTGNNAAQFEEDGPLFTRKSASEPERLVDFVSGLTCVLSKQRGVEVVEEQALY